MESPNGEKDELGLPVDSEELLHAYDELKLFSVIKLQALARRFLIRNRAVKEVYHRYEKIFDPKRKRYYYYDRTTNKSSWYKPAILLHRDFPDVAPTYLPEQAIKKIQRLIRRVMATHRVRLRYQAVITTIQDEKGKRLYFNPKSGATYPKLPKFMKGRLDYRQRKKEKKSKKKSSEMDSDESDESDEDEGEDDDEADLSPEEIIQRRRLRRKYPRSKLQLLIDRAEDNIANTFELNLSNFGVFRISSRIYDFKELKSLNLSYNNLRRVSSNIQYLFKLKSLDVSWNQIHTIAGDISELKKLEELICHHNQLSVYPGRFYRLKSLKRIDFSYNQFTEVPIEIGNLDLLKELGEWEVGFGLLTNLQVLNFSYNQLTDWPGQVDRIEGLKELYLDHNAITELIPEISNLKYLKLFTMDHNRLQKLPTEFYLLEGLEEFRASHNDLSELPNPFEEVLLGEEKESNDDEDQADPSKSASTTSPGQSTLLTPQLLASPTSPMSPAPEVNNGLLSPQSTISKSRQQQQIGIEVGSILSNPSVDSLQTGMTAPIKLVYPTYPYELSKLVLLDLSYNQFTHLGNELCICVALLELNLSHNKLLSIGEEAFGRCRQLKKLDLSYNQLATLPLSLQECKELQILRLSYNRIERLPKCLLRCSSKIHSCYLDHNQLVELDPKIITMFYELQHLELQGNQLKELSILCFSIHKLQYVDLSFNQLQSIPNDIGEAWQQLQYLDLSNNQLINLPESIGQLCNCLEIMYVHHNQLVSLPDGIYQLVKLRQLTLQYNRLSTAPYLLYSLPDLLHCNLSHNDFYYVHDMRRHFLYVRRSPWPTGFKEPLHQIPCYTTGKPINSSDNNDKATNEEEKDKYTILGNETDKPSETKEKDYREIIYDIPHIRRDLLYLREYAEEIFRELPKREESFYSNYYVSLAEAAKREEAEEQQPPPVTARSGKPDTHVYPSNSPSAAKDNEKNNNCDHFLKWLQKLRIHFNFNVEEIPLSSSSSSSPEEVMTGGQPPVGKNVPRQGSNKWNLSHSLSYSTISEQDQESIDDSRQRSTKLSIKVPATTVATATGKPPLAPTTATGTLEKRSSAGFLRGFLGGSTTTTQGPAPINANLPGLRPDHQRSMSKSFSLDTVEEQLPTEKDRPSSALVTTTNVGKSDYLHPSGKIRFTHPKPLQQFFLFHLMAKWQAISWTRSRFFLYHFQTMTNRPLAEYNQDINNPVEYYEVAPIEEDKGEESDKKNTTDPEQKRYHYSQQQSLLQQKLALAAKKQLEKKLFGLPPKKPSKRRENLEEEEEQVEEDREERQAQQRRQAISYQLLHNIGYFGSSELFEIIEQGLECISLINLLVLVEECQVMKQKVSKSLWKKPPSAIVSPQQPLSPGLVQSPGAPGGGGAIAFSRPMSPSEPLSPQVTSPLLMSPSDSQKANNKGSRFSLFSTSAKQKRRSTDNEKELSKKMTDFQQDLSKLLAATSLEMVLTALVEMDANHNSNNNVGGSNVLIEEILLKYGNFLDPEELLQALMSYHYEQFQIPSHPIVPPSEERGINPSKRKSVNKSNNPSSFRGLTTSNDSMSLGHLGVTTISNDLTMGSTASAPTLTPTHRSRSVASFVPLSVQQYEVPLSLSNSNDNSQQLRSPSGLVSPSGLAPAVNLLQRNPASAWLLTTLSARQRKNNVLIDTLPLMALPLSLIHHQEQLIRQRYFSDSFGEANVPLTDVQVNINQKQNKATTAGTNAATNKKKNMTPLLKEYLRKQKTKQILRKSFLLDVPYQNTATKTISHDRQRYLMLTESCYQDDSAGEYSIFSTLMEAYSLVIKTILLHISTQERLVRLIERQFHHQRVLERYQEYQQIKSLSVPFQHLQLFTRIELAQRSYYYLPTLIPSTTTANAESTDPNPSKKIGVERKEDYDDILYDIYLSLNVNLSSQQKKKEQKSNLSISSRRKRMVEEFLTRFYDSISLESLGIVEEDTEKEKDTTTDNTEQQKASALPLLQKQNSLASVTSHLTDVSSSSKDHNKTGGPALLSRKNTMDSTFFSHLQGSKGPASVLDDLTETEATEYMELSDEYIKLWYLYALQILQNYQEILHYRGFTPQLLLQYYLKRSGAGAGSTKTKPTKEQYDHSLLLSLIASELQNTDYAAKNQSLFNMKIFGEEKRMNEVLFQYRIMVQQLGRVYQGLGMYASALDAYYQYIQLCKGMALTKEFYLNMIKIFLTMGNFYKAHELILFVIKHYLSKSSANQPGLASNNDDDDESVMTTDTSIHYTPGELLTIDREVAILYYYILSQYELFQKTLGYNLDQSVTKLQRQQKHQQSLQHHQYFFNQFISKIPNPSYLYKIQQIEKIVVTQEMSYENIYGRNLLDMKYQQLISQEQKQQEEREKKKQEKMNYQKDIHLVKSKALLLLEDDMIANLLK